MFGPKSEQLRYAGDAAATNQVDAQADGEESIAEEVLQNSSLIQSASGSARSARPQNQDRLITLVIGCWLAVEAIVKRMREVNRMQTHQECDESPVRVVVNGEKAQRFLWCLTSALVVTYEITPKRNKDTARAVVGSTAGVLNSDRLAIYRKLFDGKAESGCMSHLRRYFWYALDTAPEESMPVIELIGELYEVEAEAKNKRLYAEQRQTLRADRSLSILNRLNAYLQATASKPRTPLAKALIYANNHWPALIFYLSDKQSKSTTMSAKGAFVCPNWAG